MKKKACTDSPKPEASSSAVQWRHLVRAKRVVIKYPKKPTKPLNKNNNNGSLRRPACCSSKFPDPTFYGHGSSWIRGPLLGKGGFGSVFSAKINTPFIHNSFSNIPSHIIAVKTSLMEHSSSLRFERKVLDDLKSFPNIVQCYGDEITKSSSGNQVYNLLLECCSGGSLHDRISKFGPNGLPELEVRRYTSDIVHGIAHIHGSKYIHCDIKPDNILLLPSTCNETCLVAKIADFGLAMEVTTDNVVIIDEDNVRGTRLYMALKLVNDNYSDWPVDIWALGCVVLEMLTGKQLWTSQNFRLNYLLHRVRDSHETSSSETPNKISLMAIDILGRCLVRNPNKRTSTWSLIHHPFVSV